LLKDLLPSTILLEEGPFCNGDQNITWSQSSHPILNEEDERQGLLRAQIWQNCLANYFLMSAEPAPQWNYIS
jgi:hypothetical protein